jgi:hypothetical protein
VVRAPEPEADQARRSPDVRALETTIREYLAITNDAPPHFVWTVTADEILAKVGWILSANL